MIAAVDYTDDADTLRIGIAIRLALHMYRSPAYTAWAMRWLGGTDRTSGAAYDAYDAAYAAYAAAYDAAYAAYDAANAAAAAAANAAAYAAAAAAANAAAYAAYAAANAANAANAAYAVNAATKQATDAGAAIDRLCPEVRMRLHLECRDLLEAMSC